MNRVLALSCRHPANGPAYQSIDVRAGTARIVPDVTSTAQNRQLTGSAFDAPPVPEPLPRFSTVIARPGPASAGQSLFHHPHRGKCFIFHPVHRGADLISKAPRSIAWPVTEMSPHHVI